MTNVQATPVSSGAPAGITASGKGTRVSEDRSDELHAMVMQQLDEDQAQDIVTIDLDGGQIEIDWRDDGVWMTGPTAHVFTGTFNSGWLEQIR